jgi:hypothetical protein
VAVKLPAGLTERFRRFPEVHLGVWRVTVDLADGRTYAGVEVGWTGEVIRVAGHASVPFTADEVVDLRDGSDPGG